MDNLNKIVTIIGVTLIVFISVFVYLHIKSSNDVTDLSGKVDKLSTKVGSLSNNVDSLSSKVDDINGIVDTSNNTITTRFIRLKRSVPSEPFTDVQIENDGGHLTIYQTGHDKTRYYTKLLTEKRSGNWVTGT